MPLARVALDQSSSPFQCLRPKRISGKRGNALRLHQRQYFKKFIQRAKSPRHEHKGDAVFDKADLARKKVMKMDRHIGVSIALLFVWQFNVQAHRFALDGRGAAIGRFHDARPAAGDDGEIMLRQILRELDRRLVIPGFSGWVRAEPKIVTPARFAT